MASFRKTIWFLIAFFITFITFISSTHARTFQVGGKDGWTLNPSENYNSWSGRLRFLINDTLYFKYDGGTDSVLVVNKGDYDGCNANNPIMKMGGGDSMFKLDRSGPFYFITGNKSNCDQGQKMAVVVLALRNRSPPPSAATPPSLSPSPALSPVKTPSTSPVSPPSHAVSPGMPPSGSPEPSASGSPMMTPPASSPSGETADSPGGGGADSSDGGSGGETADSPGGGGADSPGGGSGDASGGGGSGQPPPPEANSPSDAGNAPTGRSGVARSFSGSVTALIVTMMFALWGIKY